MSAQAHRTLFQMDLPVKCIIQTEALQAEGDTADQSLDDSSVTLFCSAVAQALIQGLCYARTYSRAEPWTGCSVGHSTPTNELSSPSFLGASLENGTQPVQDNQDHIRIISGQHASLGSSAV